MTVKESLERIEKNAHLRAVIEINPDVLDIVPKEGILNGAPVLVKDNVNTGDKMQTTAGAMSLEGNVADTDAPAAANLRASGAVIVGKANMTEFANYMCDFRLDERMPNGYSSRGGQTMHPMSADFDPSGSSTGSAVAVAAGLVSMAVGSETYGSIISPAQSCGIVGLKPTDGLISKEGVIPISFTLDTLGPLADTAQNAGLLLSALANKAHDMNKDPKTIKVGICHIGADNADLPMNSPDWRKANLELIERMKAAGMDVKDLPDGDIAKWAAPGNDFFVFPVMRYEFKYAINSYLKSAKNAPKDLSEIIAFNKANAEAALKYGQGNLVAANEISDDWQNQSEYVEAMADRELAISALDKYFSENDIDILMMLSAHCGIAAGTGFPSLTMPLGKDAAGKPIGCLLMARRFDENTLLSCAKAIE